MNTLNIANNIVRLRHDKKITQEQLAEFIGVTKASVSKWENNQSTPDITILPLLASITPNSGQYRLYRKSGYPEYIKESQLQRHFLEKYSG